MLHEATWKTQEACRTWMSEFQALPEGQQAARAALLARKNSRRRKTAEARQLQQAPASATPPPIAVQLVLSGPVQRAQASSSSPSVSSSSSSSASPSLSLSALGAASSPRGSMAPPLPRPPSAYRPVMQPLGRSLTPVTSPAATEPAGPKSPPTSKSSPISKSPLDSKSPLGSKSSPGSKSPLGSKSSPGSKSPLGSKSSPGSKFSSPGLESPSGSKSSPGLASPGLQPLAPPPQTGPEAATGKAITSKAQSKATAALPQGQQGLRRPPLGCAYKRSPRVDPAPAPPSLVLLRPVASVIPAGPAAPVASAARPAASLPAAKPSGEPPAGETRSELAAAPMVPVVPSGSVAFAQLGQPRAADASERAELVEKLLAASSAQTFLTLLSLVVVKPDIGAVLDLMPTRLPRAGPTLLAEWLARDELAGNAAALATTLLPALRRLLMLTAQLDQETLLRLGADRLQRAVRQLRARHTSNLALATLLDDILDTLATVAAPDLAVPIPIPIPPPPLSFAPAPNSTLASSASSSSSLSSSLSSSSSSSSYLSLLHELTGSSPLLDAAPASPSVSALREDTVDADEAPDADFPTARLPWLPSPPPPPPPRSPLRASLPVAHSVPSSVPAQESVPPRLRPAVPVASSQTSPLSALAPCQVSARSRRAPSSGEAKTAVLAVAVSKPSAQGQKRSPSPSSDAAEPAAKRARCDVGAPECKPAEPAEPVEPVEPALGQGAIRPFRHSMASFSSSHAPKPKAPFWFATPRAVMLAQQPQPMDTTSSDEDDKEPQLPPAAAAALKVAATESATGAKPAAAETPYAQWKGQLARMGSSKAERHFKLLDLYRKPGIVAWTVMVPNDAGLFASRALDGVRRLTQILRDCLVQIRSPDKDDQALNVPIYLLASQADATRILDQLTRAIASFSR